MSVSDRAQAPTNFLLANLLHGSLQTPIQPGSVFDQATKKCLQRTSISAADFGVSVRVVFRKYKYVTKILASLSKSLI